MDRGEHYDRHVLGTSLHACRVAAGWVRLLTGGAIRPAAIDAHDLALLEGVPPADQVVVFGHRGNKHRPNEVLAKARAVGAPTITITGEGPAAPEADVGLRTCPQEQARTHTVSYLTALTLLGRLVAAMLGDDGAPLDEALAATPDALRRPLELPLAEGMPTEFALHGTPAVFSASTVGYLIRPAGSDGGRTDELATLLARLGASVSMAGDAAGDPLPFAPVPSLARPFVTVVPFQRLVSVAAVRLGASPDRTHLDEESWKSAILAVEL